MIHFIYLIAFTCVLYIYTYSLKQNPPSDEFFKVNIVQVVTPILQLLTLSAIAYFINIKLSYKNKKIGLLIMHIDTIIDDIHSLSTHTRSYFQINEEEHTDLEESKNIESSILHLLKELSNKITFLEQLSKNAKVEKYTVDKSQSKNILLLKQEITSEHFKQATSYPKSQQIKIEKMFTSLLNDYTLEKLRLYK